MQVWAHMLLIRFLEYRRLSTLKHHCGHAKWYRSKVFIKKSVETVQGTHTLKHLIEIIQVFLLFYSKRKLAFFFFYFC